MKYGLSLKPFSVDLLKDRLNCRIRASSKPFFLDSGNESLPTSNQLIDEVIFYPENVPQLLCEPTKSLVDVPGQAP